MKERATPPTTIEGSQERVPSFDRISRGLTRLLAANGLPVKEGFPPGKRLSEYDHAAGHLTLHPWLPMKLRAECLLDAAVSRLETVEYERRLQAYDDDEVEVRWYQGDDEPWRATLVKSAAGRRLGLMSEEIEDDELSPGEQDGWR